MHLVEIYSLLTASKIEKPFIVQQYFPLATDKYITIQNSTGMRAKEYDYFEAILDFVLPILTKEGYTVFQLGGDKDKSLNGCIHLQGKTTINQTAYILNNTSLHISSDSFSIHLCAAYGRPLIGLYSIIDAENAGPYKPWCHPTKTSVLSVDFSEKRPSYNPEENPKRVNEIKPETIISEIGRILELDFGSYKNIYTGPDHSSVVLELVPNCVLGKDFFANQICSIRADWVEGEINSQIIAANLAQRKCMVVTDRPLDVEVLAPYRRNVEQVMYDISTGYDLNFLKQLRAKGLKVHIFHEKNDKWESEKESLQLSLINYGVISAETSITKEKSLDFCPPIQYNNTTRYKTSKIILSNKKIYLSRAALKADHTSPHNDDSLEWLTPELEEFFYEDLDYLYIYQT